MAPEASGRGEKGTRGGLHRIGGSERVSTESPAVEIPNSKHQIRNKLTRPEIQMSKTEIRAQRDTVFGPWTFAFGICFGFGFSDLGFRGAPSSACA
jgi:hypothetical protein